MKYSNFETIKTTFEFQNVYNNGASFANRDFVMYVAKNDCGKRRLGVSVSKKIGNSVTRHRLSRLVREAFRLNASSVDEDIDIVVIDLIWWVRVTRKQKAQCCIYSESIML